VKLLGELSGLGAELLGTQDNLAGDNLEVILDGLLKLFDGRGHLDLLALDSEAASLHYLRVVAAATAVPGEEVGGIRVREVGESTFSSDRDDVIFELLGDDGGDGEFGIAGRLERQVVGKETGDVRRGHGGTGDGIDGVLGADPGGLDAQARGEDVSALAIVGEIGAAIIQSGGTNSEGLGSGSGRIVASIGIVIASSDGEVNAHPHGSVDSGVEGLGLATTKGHVGDGALEALSLACLGKLDLTLVGEGGVLDSLDNIGHGAGSVGSEYLDGMDVSLLGDTILLASDSAGTVGAMTIAILISVVGRDSLAPLGATFKVDVVDVDTSVDDIGIDTLAAVSAVKILIECSKVKSLSVRETSKTPGGMLLRVTVALVLSHQVLGLEGKHRVDKAVSLDVLDIRVIPDLLDDGLMEVASIALEGVANVERVLQPSINMVRRGIDGSLAKLKALLLSFGVDIFHPAVVLIGADLIDMIFELDDI